MEDRSMKGRLSLLALGAAVLIWSGAAPSGAQDKHPDHKESKRKAPATHEEIMKQMMQMSPEERRKFHEEMAKHGGTGSHKHGAGAHGSHAAVKAGRGKKSARLSIGETVPDFIMKDARGKTLRLSDLRKQTKSGIVSLTFWCTFCHSCRDVEGPLDRFAHEQEGKVVVAAIDSSVGETSSGISAFAKKKHLTLPIVIDGQGKAAELFGVTLTTTTVVIDGEGRLRYRGQFAEGDKSPAMDALHAVLSGKPVMMKETRQRG
jgi:peroxiredoxin